MLTWLISHQSPLDWAMLQVDERPVWKRVCLRIQTWARPCQKGSPSPLEQVNPDSCGTYDDLPHWHPHPGRRGHGRCLATLPQRAKTVPPHPLGGQNATSRPGQQTHSRFMQSKMHQASRMCISSTCTTRQKLEDLLVLWSLKAFIKTKGSQNISVSHSHKIYIWGTPWHFKLIFQGHICMFMVHPVIGKCFVIHHYRLKQILELPFGCKITDFIPVIKSQPTLHVLALTETWRHSQLNQLCLLPYYIISSLHVSKYYYKTSVLHSKLQSWQHLTRTNSKDPRHSTRSHKWTFQSNFTALSRRIPKEIEQCNF